jgi:uncharacterized membrane protein YczE
MVGAAMLLGRKPGPGTVAQPFIAGAFLDAILPHMGEVHGLALQLAAVLLATWFSSLAGALMIAAGLGMSGYDGIMMGIHRHTGIAVVTIRVAMEASMLAGGFVLGGAIGLGTVITGALIGPGIQFWLRRTGYQPAEWSLAGTKVNIASDVGQAVSA